MSYRELADITADRLRWPRRAFLILGALFGIGIGLFAERLRAHVYIPHRCVNIVQSLVSSKARLECPAGTELLTIDLGPSGIPVAVCECPNTTVRYP